MLISKDYLGQALGANKILWVMTDPQNFGPLLGKYWMIRYLTVFDSDNNGQAFSAYLVDQSAYSTWLQSLQTNGEGIIPDFDSALGGPPPQGIHKLGPGNGDSGGQTLWGTTSQRGGGGASAQSTGWRDIYLPFGWAIYIVETNGLASAISHQLLLRTAYQEINAGCAPNDPGPQWS